MDTSLWKANTPAKFWHACPGVELPRGAWEAAAQASAQETLGAPFADDAEIESLLSQTLGEGQFGPSHWQLSRAKRLYYELKPLLPRGVIRFIRRIYRFPAEASFPLSWPVEERYARFQWEVMRHLMSVAWHDAIPFIHFWPEGHRYAFVLTHDIETAHGQARARAVADLEEGLGFRSSFNFVPEGYQVDLSLVAELFERGFEIGIHGLRHDGKLFSSQAEFSRRVTRINRYLQEFGAVGFRAPLTHRHPGWMQELEIEYDSSFFDTDPFEPIPGGTMSIWPFFIGRFVELPYTLPQDYTLMAILGEKTPRIWAEKVDLIERYHGMALLNTHPDYLKAPANFKMYADFVDAMKQRGGYWHALPRKVAAWWRARAEASSLETLPGAVQATARLVNGNLTIDIRQRGPEGPP